MHDEPRPVSEVLGAIERELELPDARGHAELLRRWPDLVGDALSRHCVPAAVRDGVLRIAADAPPWASQCRYLEAALVERLEVELPELGVSEVRVSVLRPDA